MDAHSLALLEMACTSWDDAEAARAEIKKHGLIITAPSGQRRKNPAVEALKAARDSFLRSWTALNLDTEPPGPNPGSTVRPVTVPPRSTFGCAEKRRRERFQKT